ncbi:MAG: UMP kinase [Patescibacteria group bacterium]|jgi:uridylate kinase
MNQPPKRILLKLSGEILAGKDGAMYDHALMERLARELGEVIAAGTQVFLVVGAGNIVRGAELAKESFDRVGADYMGMLATIINGIALQDAFERSSLETRVMSAIEAHEIAEPFIRRRAERHAEKGRIVILAGGTGNPFFTTDSAAVLRANELDCDLLLKGTKVDGVYTSDPKQDPTATRYERVSYDEVIARELRVMDMTAFTMARDSSLPIVVFDILQEGALIKAARGEVEVGTLVTA